MPHTKDAKFPSRNSRKLVKILPLRIYNTSWMTNLLITPPAPRRGVTDHAERKGRLGKTQSPDTCRSRRHSCDPNLPFKPYVKKILTRMLISVNINVIYFTEESVTDATRTGYSLFDADLRRRVAAFPFRRSVSPTKGTL